MTGDDYDVEATSPDGEVLRATGSGPVAELVARYRAEGWQVSRLTGRRTRRLFEPAGCDPQAFALFNAELAAACAAGVALPRALRAVGTDLGSRRFRRAVEQVAAAVEEGEDLASALDRQPEVFGPAYRVLVRAGLSVGDLPGVLLDVAADGRLTARIRSAVRLALVYPVVLAVLCAALVSAIAWSFEAFGGEALASVESLARGDDGWDEMGYGPAHGPEAEVDFALGLALFRWSPAILLVCLGALVVGGRVLEDRWRSNRWLAATILALPVVGAFAQAAALARFARTLAAALGRGIGVPESVELAGLASGNAVVQASSRSVALRLAEGAPLAAGLEAEEVFPLALVWMVEVGQHRGDLVPILGEIAGLQEERMERCGAALPVLVQIVGTGLGAAVVFGTIYVLLLPIARTLSSIL